MDQNATKIVRLSHHNVRAIREVIVPLFPNDGIGVTVHDTTAAFPVPPAEAARIVNEAIMRLPGRGHPRASLHAVLRKIVAQIPPATEAEVAKITDVQS